PWLTTYARRYAPRAQARGSRRRGFISPRLALSWFSGILSRRRDVTHNALHHPGGPTRRTGRHGHDPGPARHGGGRGRPRLRPGLNQSPARSLRGPRRRLAGRAPAGGADSRRALLRRRYPGTRLLGGRSALSTAAASIPA